MYLAIENTVDKDLRIRIINTLGDDMIVIEGQLLSQSNNYRLDLSSLPGGIYFVQVNLGEQQVVKKIILQK